MDPSDAPDPLPVEPLLKPLDFRLNLGARRSEPVEPLPNLDSPAIRKLTWEHVVPGRSESSPATSSASAALPLPSRVLSSLIPLEEMLREPRPASGSAPLPDPSGVEVEPIAAEAEAEAEVAVAVDDFGDLGEEIVAEVVAPELPDPAVDETPDGGMVEDQIVVEDEVVVDAVEDDEAAVDEEIAVDDVDFAADDVDDVAFDESAPRYEVNRLASVPDLIDDELPVELPPITPSGPGPVIVHAPSIYSPVLAEAYYIPPVLPAATQGPTVVKRELKAQRPNRPKPKRHLVRTFFTLVVLFGLLAGGAFAAKTYLLKQPKWSAELKPLADNVSVARGLQFKNAVTVTEVPVADYAQRLASSVVDTSADQAPTWRALGLLNGELDLDGIGRQAMNDSPAFYDPESQTIFVTEDLKVHPHLYRFAMHRALTAALLDQEFDWGWRLGSTSPAAVLAVRSTIDGDALAVANRLAADDTPEQLAPELFAFVQGHGGSIASSQYAVAIAGRAGVAMRPTMASLSADTAALAGLEQATAADDSVLDVVRADLPSAGTAPGAHGMMFWYYVLASRIDDGQAWSAAVRWTADSVATSTGPSSPCVDATVSAADPDGAAVLLGAFESWAAAAPAEAATTVVAIEGNRVAIRACDPGAGVAAQNVVKMPVAFGASGVERALVGAAVSAAGGAKVDAACLVTAARQRGMALTLAADDAPVLAVTWEPVYVAANIDLAPGCVSAPG